MNNLMEKNKNLTMPVNDSDNKKHSDDDRPAYGDFDTNEQYEENEEN